MGKESEIVSVPEIPREKFLECYKNSIRDFEPGGWKTVLNVSAEQLFEERKGWSSSRVGAELTDAEYIEEWVRNPNLGKNAVFELGVAYGEMIVLERNSDEPLR